LASKQKDFLDDSFVIKRIAERYDFDNLDVFVNNFENWIYSNNQKGEDLINLPLVFSPLFEFGADLLCEMILSIPGFIDTCGGFQKEALKNEIISSFGTGRFRGKDFYGIIIKVIDYHCWFSESFAVLYVQYVALVCCFYEFIIEKTKNDSRYNVERYQARFIDLISCVICSRINIDGLHILNSWPTVDDEFGDVKQYRAFITLFLVMLGNYYDHTGINSGVSGFTLINLKKEAETEIGRNRGWWPDEVIDGVTKGSLLLYANKNQKSFCMTFNIVMPGSLKFRDVEYGAWCFIDKIEDVVRAMSFLLFDNEFFKECSRGLYGFPRSADYLKGMRDLMIATEEFSLLDRRLIQSIKGYTPDYKKSKNDKSLCIAAGELLKTANKFSKRSEKIISHKAKDFITNHLDMVMAFYKKVLIHNKTDDTWIRCRDMSKNKLYIELKNSFVWEGIDMTDDCLAEIVSQLTQVFLVIGYTEEKDKVGRTLSLVFNILISRYLHEEYPATNILKYLRNN